ncbi:MAG TPA: DUF2911 domain-containing protein [Planctomycetota bacterium]|nr:DUF2911 domain-containing protein [Planctomycetota bacterium]
MFPFTRDLPRTIAVGLATLFFVEAASAQQRLPTPWASPASTMSQVIGITDVTVTFGRPGVKGRAIWGGLVPYDEVWRAGANENTTISFGNDVKVEGQALPAGTYGLHMIPHKDSWTIIFSKNSTSWGSFSYDQREDALRVDVKPEASPMHEWLTYEFDDLAADHATLRLCWEKLAVPIRISVDTTAVVLDNARNVYLRGIPQFSWDGWNNAARYCLANKVNLDEGLAWAQRSVTMGPNFQNLWTEGGLLEALGKKDEAAAAKDKAMTLAAEADLNTLGYQYLQGGRIDDALAIFRRNVEAHPDSWNAYDSLAEACAAKGDKKTAIEMYGKALAMTPDDTQKTRIKAALATLGS